MTKRRAIVLFIVPLALTFVACALIGSTTQSPAIRAASVIIAVLAAALVATGALFIRRSNTWP